MNDAYAGSGGRSSARTWQGRPTPNVALPPAGAILDLDIDDWSYGRGQQPGSRFILVISRVRHELSACYEGRWVWVDGHAIDCGGQHPPCRQALVRVEALDAA